jgi:branched-chain amino acid transport system permease protein
MMGSVYALIALGYSLIYKASGLMSFMQGEFLMLGSFFGLTFFSILKLPFFISLIFSMAVMFIIGFLVEKYVIRILQKKGAVGIYVVLATIALSMIGQNFAMLTWGSRVFYFPPIFNVEFVTIGSVNIVPESILALVVSLFFMVIFHIFMTRTKLGTSMRAAAQDAMAARSIGINVSLTTGITWGIAASLAGIAGILIGPLFGVHAVMGGTISLKGFAGACIGGYGDMFGSVIGSFILGGIETFTAGYISSVYKDFISFFILILVLVIKPTGLFNAAVYDD